MRIVTDEEFYFIDANIPLYAVGAESRFKQPCIQILSDIAQYNLPVWSNVEVLQEVLHIYNGRKRRADGIKIVNDFTTVVDNIMSVHQKDLDRAMLLMEQMPSAAVRDTIHVATMLHCGITNIVSADKHFANVPSIRRIDPLDWRAHLVKTGVVDNTTTDSEK